MNLKVMQQTSDYFVNFIFYSKSTYQKHPRFSYNLKLTGITLIYKKVKNFKTLQCTSKYRSRLLEFMKDAFTVKLTFILKICSPNTCATFAKEYLCDFREGLLKFTSTLTEKMAKQCR